MSTDYVRDLDTIANKYATIITPLTDLTEKLEEVRQLLSMGDAACVPGHFEVTLKLDSPKLVEAIENGNPNTEAAKAVLHNIGLETADTLTEIYERLTAMQKTMEIAHQDAQCLLLRIAGDSPDSLTNRLRKLLIEVPKSAHASTVYKSRHLPSGIAIGLALSIWVEYLAGWF